MFFYEEDHLRITKIRTNDGISPVMGEDERPMKKVIFAPLNPQTKKLFEEENSRKPNQLKMKIEVVKAYNPPPIISKTETDNSILEERNKDLAEQNRILQEQLKALTTAKVAEPSPNGNTLKDQGSKSTVKTNQHETVQ